MPLLRTTNAELQAALDNWDALCESRDIRKMCASFVPLDVGKEDMEVFASDFETDQER